MTQSNVSLTSDFDYLKLVQDDTLFITTSAVSDPDFAFPTDPFGGFGSGEQGVVPINHNLGSVPLIRAFIDSANNGTWYSSYFQNGYILIDPNLLILNGTMTTKFCVNAGSHKSNVPVYYRLYEVGSQAINSDRRIDKIFSKNPGVSQIIGPCTFSSDNVQADITIPHNQNEAICWTMQFSQDNINWYNDGNFIYGPPDTNSGPPGGPYSYYYYQRAYGRADNNTFYIRIEHNYPTNRTFYVRWTLDYRA